MQVTIASNNPCTAACDAEWNALNPTWYTSQRTVIHRAQLKPRNMLIPHMIGITRTRQTQKRLFAS